VTDQCRLADASRTEDDDEPAHPVPGLVSRRLDRGDLVFTTDEPVGPLHTIQYRSGRQRSS
jgi:hypothetical protein